MDDSTPKVAYPKLTLYAFHLRQNLAQDLDKSVENANHLWHKCQEIGKKLGISELENLSIPENTQILDENVIKFTPIKHQHNLNLTGEINRIQIHDTYALDLTFRYPHPEVELTDLKGLNQDNCLLPNNIKASLGQTLVFFAQPIGNIDDDKKLKKLAEACVKALISKEEFKKLKLSSQAKGKLLNSPIFEYNYEYDNGDRPENQFHILIWLNTNQQTTDLEETGDYYYPLIDLLNCRSKIIYAHSESRWCYRQARKEYSKLEDKVKQFNQVKNQPVDSKLKDFNQWLNEIPETSFNYARYLRDLEFQRNTIKSNLKNYKLYLDKIKQLCSKDDLEFVSNFAELAEDTYIEQITTDLAYLTPGQSLFEQLIESIRGIVEIERTKRDRNLERTFQVLGTAFGGGAIVSGVVTQHIDKPFAPINLKYPIHPLVSSLLWSLLATVIFGMVAWFVTKPKANT